MVISIDIGTSYSSICLRNGEDKAEPVETSTGISIYGGQYSLPSAVFVEEGGKVLVGQAAMNSRKKKPQNFCSEFKRVLGQNVPIKLGESSFLPEELYTELFRHMKGCAEKGGKGTVEKAYITYPASFGKDKREKICQAAKNAGLFDVELIDEPTAAAMCCRAQASLEDGDVLLVYDFGGGTFDGALIRYAGDSYEALAPAVGIDHCGGIDIDRAIYADMMSMVDEETLRQLSANKTNKLRFEGQIAELAVKVKHHLSSAERAEEAIPIGFDILDYEIDRDRLNGMIAGMVSQTVDCCERILKSAGLTVKDVSRILMVGGTSRVPLVQEMVRRFADGAPVYADVDPDLAVAIGALEKSYEETWETFTQCKRAAERGNAAAQNDLGNKYYNGEGVERDYKEAVKWYRRSAEQGDAIAQYNLGNMYNQGEGVERDYEEAVKWYRRSAEQGNAEAQFDLGFIYYNGEGVERDYKEAVKWYRRSAEQGNAIGQYSLGNRYYNGEGVERDYKEAVKWYRRSAEQGNAIGQFGLGTMYANGKGVERDYKEAVKWYRRSAEQGNAIGQYSLGNRYYNGEGVERDYKEAVKWYRRSAEQGNAIGQFGLGTMYANGKGVERDYKEAVKWYRRSAEQGNARAQYNLSGIEETRETFTQRKRAVERGNAEAQFHLENRRRELERENEKIMKRHREQVSRIRELRKQLGK